MPPRVFTMSAIGNNNFNGVSGFNAGPGYDESTGWGTHRFQPLRQCGEDFCRRVLLTYPDRHVRSPRYPNRDHHSYADRDAHRQPRHRLRLSRSSERARWLTPARRSAASPSMRRAASLQATFSSPKSLSMTASASDVPTAPSGWTSIRHDAVSNGNNATSWLYYKVAGASEPASYGWNLARIG